MKHLIMFTFITITLASCQPVYAGETCVTTHFCGITTTRCKEDGEVTSVCKSREFGGKIITNCK